MSSRRKYSNDRKIKDGGVAGINGMLEAEDVAKISLDQMA